MFFLINVVVCASMAVDAACHTANPKAGVTYSTREECEEMTHMYNNKDFQMTSEKLDKDGKPMKTWTYYCRVVSTPIN